MREMLLAAVGEGGMNYPKDVATVQATLNRVTVGQGGPKAKLLVDGVIGPKTLQAIRDFQQRQGENPDGAVTPAGMTFRKLQQAVGPAVALNDGDSYLTPRLNSRLS